MTLAFPPRLMTEEETAEYLGKVPLTEVKRLTIGRVPFGKSVRWDRVAIDAHLDALSGLSINSPTRPAETAVDDPEAALDRFTGP